MPLLEVRELTLEVDTPSGPVAVVDRLSLQIERAAGLGLLGESGCGKSLTALALLQLLPAAVRLTGGSIRFDGQELVGMGERGLRAFRGGRIGMVFQEPGASLNPVLRVGGQVEEILALHQGLGRAARGRACEQLFAEVGLPDPARLARRYPHELSGGQQQRVALAIALAGEPELLIADEPTTALDVTVQAQVLARLRVLRRERGLALLWISHDLGVVAETCERVAVMYAGRIAELGPVRELFAAPRHPYARGLVAAVPRLDRREAPRGIPGRVPMPADFPGGCRFRDRCGDAHAACAEEPARVAPTAAHAAACWLESAR